MRAPIVATAARTATLLAVGALLGVALNALRPDGVRPDRIAAAVSCSAGPHATPVAGSPVGVLPPSEAMSLCGDPRALIADVRPPERFAAGHVAGAVHLPCATSGEIMAGALARRFADQPGPHTVIAYGDSTAEAVPVAEALCARLGAATRVVVIDGGFAAWDRAGLACSSGPCPECQETAANGTPPPPRSEAAPP